MGSDERTSQQIGPRRVQFQFAEEEEINIIIIIMWRLRGALLLLAATAATLSDTTSGQSVGFYAPQYELLDPRTGRSVSQGFKIVRQPLLEQRSLPLSLEEDYSSRVERDTSSSSSSPDFFSGYFKPEGFKFPSFAASIRSSPDDFHSSPTYFTQDRECSLDRDDDSASHTGFIQPKESSGFFSSDQSMPNFFRMFGSGFKNEPSPLPEKYRFTRHSFPEYTPDPTPSARRAATPLSRRSRNQSAMKSQWQRIPRVTRAFP